MTNVWINTDEFFRILVGKQHIDKQKVVYTHFHKHNKLGGRATVKSVKKNNT